MSKDREPNLRNLDILRIFLASGIFSTKLEEAFFTSRGFLQVLHDGRPPVLYDSPESGPERNAVSQKNACLFNLRINCENLFEDSGVWRGGAIGY